MAFRITDLGTLGGTSSDGVALNASGQATGTSTTAGGEMHAFLWDGAKLRDLGTLVVLDTPPARWAADALSLADAADATLIVTRANRSRWRATVELATALRRDRLPVLGVVLVGRRQRRLAHLARRAARRWADRAPAVEAVPLTGSDEGHGRARSGR